MKLCVKFNLLILFNIMIIFFAGNINSNYCSYETCRRCCQVTPTGCVNAMDYNIRVSFILTIFHSIEKINYCVINKFCIYF
jgi:hypothetical protein